MGGHIYTCKTTSFWKLPTQSILIHLLLFQNLLVFCRLLPFLPILLFLLSFYPYPFWLLFYNHSYQTVQTLSYGSFLFHLIQSNSTGGKTFRLHIFYFVRNLASLFFALFVLFYFTSRNSRCKKLQVTMLKTWNY